MLTFARKLIIQIQNGIPVVGKGSWKEAGKSEVGKFLFKLERAKRSWRVSFEVGKF